MLQLLQAYAGCPQSELQFLHLPLESLLVRLHTITTVAFSLTNSQLYPSADSVVVRNAHDFTFRRALAFWEAFPGTRHLSASLKCLAIDPGMKLVREVHS